MEERQVPSVYFEPGFEPHVEVVRPPRRPYFLHALLFLGAVLTTLIVGARLEDNFLAGRPMFSADEHFFPVQWALSEPSRLLMGIPFSASLLGILLAHEMGHFVYAVRNRVYATLPFFLPAPTPIGTFGAFIQIKSLFRSRRALFDIGIAGPIAGFIVAVPLTMVGLLLSRPLPVGTPAMEIGYPLIFHVIHWLLPVREGLHGLLLHPVAIAAWTGMLATALNLIPGGQLDGGHIVYGLRPAAHAPVTRAAILVMLPLAYFFWSGWIFWGLGLTMTRRHPQVPEQPAMPVSRKALAWLAAIMLLLTFLPAPFPGGSFYELLHQ
jgi:membrane-associated protease RseP (regulator of RpoE activity)